MEERRPRKRRKKRRGTIYKPVSVILILIILGFSISIFFKIAKIEVTGLDACTEEEVIAASGIELEDNLFFIDKFNAINKIFKNLPYVEEVTITRKLPDTVVIGITECIAIASVRIGDNIWLMDRTGKLLEKTDQAGAEGTITLHGITPLAPVAGQRVSLGESENLKMEYLVSLLGALCGSGIYEEVGSIDMSNPSDVIFEYMGRFKVRLGQNNDLDDKLYMLAEVIEQLSASDIGEINLSKKREAHFIPG